LQMVPGKERHKLNQLLTDGICWRTFRRP
jgi:hypothetical protein